MRHGTEMARVPMGGCLVEVAKPRVRATDGSGEVALEVWAEISSRDLLNAHTVASMLAGVSTRNYPAVLEAVGDSIDEASHSTSHSAVSRRFVAATRKGLAAFRSRPLDGRRWLVVYLDGFDFAGETMVGALASMRPAPRSPSPWCRARRRTRRSVPGGSTASKNAGSTPARECCS